MNEPPDRELAVFSAVRRLPARERVAYLDEACAGDAALRQRVEELLEASEEAGAFLEDPAQGTVPPNPDATLRITPLPAEKPGDRIGRYKLLQQIGEGGCGVVYMAEQEEPVRRRVALKVIKLGMDTKSVIARFEAERQALALMDHPSIARVLDAGATDTGRPYFVMELVRGIKITEFCDQKQLSTRERLGLFVQVCQAIQHAHQKGIIHRDIKPSNILVTLRDGVPVPKVIDFGIAKATTDQRLTDKTLFTQFEMFIGTPAYMSPEQAEMSELGIDTRSDIYSLGILLYELLTGTTPFDARELMKAGLVEIRRIIREEEPARPSTRLTTMAAADLTDVARHRHAEPGKLSNLIRGDLDWIVMKALEKDRARRYETANGLATDIQRHLKCEPVVARPPSRLYEFQKTVRRHKFGFAAAGAVTVALMIGLAVSTWQVIEKSRAYSLTLLAEQKARTEAIKSQRVALFLQEMLKGVGPAVAVGRDTKLLREILDNTAERVGKDLTNEPIVEAELRTTIGEAYYAIGEDQKAKAMLRQAVDIWKKHPGSELLDSAASMKALAMVLWRQGELAEAEALARGALATERKLLSRDNLDAAASLYVLATVLNSKNDLAGAEDALREALNIQRKLLGDEHLDVTETLGGLSAVLQRRGQLAEAESMAREVLATRRKLLGNEHPSVAGALNGVGNVLRQLNRLDEAETSFREALAMRRRLLGKEHPDLVQSLNNLGRVLEAQGKLDEAEGLCREALTMRRNLLRGDHVDVAASASRLIAVLRKQGKFSEAEDLCVETLAMQRRLSGNQSRAVDVCLVQLGGTLQDQSKLVEAEAVYREELALERTLSGNEHPLVAASLIRLSFLLRDEGKLPEAENTAREALAMRHDAELQLRIVELFREQAKWAEAEHYYSEAARILRATRKAAAVASVLHAHALRAHGQSFFPQAEQAYLDALASYREAYGGTNADMARCLYDLARVLSSQTKYAQAEAAARESLAMRQKLFRDAHPDVILSLVGLVHALQDQGKRAEAGTKAREAAQKYHAAMAQYENLASDRNRHQECCSFANSYEELGQFLRQIGRTQDAETTYLDTQILWRKLVADYDTEDNRFRLAVNYDALGQLLKEAGRFDEAAETYRQALAVWRKLVAEFNKDTYRNRLAGTLVTLATTLQTEGKRSGAEQFFREVAEHAGAQTLNELAWRLATDPDPNLRDGPSAVALAEKAVAGTNRNNPMIMDTLAAAYAAAGRFTNAVRVQQEAISLLQNEPEKKDYASRLKLYENNSSYQDPSALAALASDRLRDGKFAEAEVLARECLTLREKLMPDDWRTFNARSVLGGALLGQKKFSDAEPLLLLGYDGMKQREDNIPADGKPRLGQSLQRLVQLYEATNRPEQAAEWKQKQAEFDKTEN